MAAVYRSQGAGGVGQDCGRNRLRRVLINARIGQMSALAAADRTRRDTGNDVNDPKRTSNRLRGRGRVGGVEPRTRRFSPRNGGETHHADRWVSPTLNPRAECRLLITDT